MKGVILAGGEGSRLHPLTAHVNKHLLAVGEVPMIVHPLRRLVQAGIEDILMVSTPDGTGELARTLGDGYDYGCSLFFRVQEHPAGIADALQLAEPFAPGEPLAVVLGDNVFDAPLSPHLQRFRAHGATGALVLVHRVSNPQRFGIACVQGDRIVDIQEKPSRPCSDLAVTGIYVYDGSWAERLHTLRPSDRGELEITDLNRSYLRSGTLAWAELGGRWIDAGTREAYRTANELFAAPGE